MNTSHQLQSLLKTLGQHGSAVPPDLQNLLSQLLALLQAIPLSGGSINSLKKPGAWRDRPLPHNTPDAPYYINVPGMIEIVNVSPAELSADLHRYQPQPDGFGNTKLTIPKPHHHRR